MKQDIFDKGTKKNELSHADEGAIIKSAIDGKASLKDVYAAYKAENPDTLTHADGYGIKGIEALFPEAKTLNVEPEFITRDMEWVNKVVDSASKRPFSRIKSHFADITADEARARGYIKGTQKLDEVFTLLSRVTDPTTIYKKQKLDRDDVLDITDFNVVNFIRREMKIMLKEEIGRAVLISDGRQVSDASKIKEDKIRPIMKDDPFYTLRVTLEANVTADQYEESLIRGLENFEGSPNPSLYTTKKFINDIMLSKDTTGKRLYKTKNEFLDTLSVKEFVDVPLMKDLTMTEDGVTYDVLAILVNMKDYVIGADKGGEVTTFDDFDIDFNQYKYLMETRISGALVKPRSAIVIRKKRA